MIIKPLLNNHAMRRLAATLIGWLPGLMLLLVLLLALLSIPGRAEARHGYDWAANYARTAVVQAQLAGRYRCDLRDLARCRRH